MSILPKNATSKNLREMEKTAGNFNQSLLVDEYLNDLRRFNELEEKLKNDEKSKQESQSKSKVDKKETNDKNDDPN